MSIFSKIRDGLKNTRENIKNSLSSIVKNFKGVNEEFLEELEETLIMADVGVYTSNFICDELRRKAKKEKIKDEKDLKFILKEIMVNILGESKELDLKSEFLLLLIIGVNGVGKTTSIGKLSNFLTSEGKNVILAAADTFRAAAIEQLEFWAQKCGVDIIKQKEGSDPSAVIFDTICAAKSRNKNVIICDTAGRLHNKKDLMSELEKMSKIIKRELPNSKQETLLVLDATTGQNAINQAKEFKKVTDVSGIILTKLDSSAKGGIVFSIKKELEIPVRFIGIGEKIEDFEKFSACDFVKGII